MNALFTDPPPKADPLCSFTLKQLTSMMKQIFDYDRAGVTIVTANPHIPRSQWPRIRVQILGPLEDPSINTPAWRPNWPTEFPIFSPYAITKGAHSAGMYTK